MADFDLNAKLTLDTTEYDKDLNNSLKGAASFYTSVQKIFSAKSPDAAMNLALNTAGQFAWDSVQPAALLQNANGMVRTVFGAYAKRVDPWAETTLYGFGLSEQKAKQYVSLLGQEFTGVGVSVNEAANLSMELVERIGDLASFFDLDQDKVYEMVRSAVAGEADALTALGVTLPENYAGMTAQERANNLLERTNSAQGSFQNKTGLAHEVSLVQGFADSIKTEVGEQLVLPIAQMAAEAFNKMIGNGQGLSLQDIYGGLDATFDELMAEHGSTMTDAYNMVDYLSGIAAGGIADEEREKWKAGLQSFAENVPQLAGLIDVENGKVKGGIAGLRSGLEALDANTTKQMQSDRLQEKWNAKNQQQAQLDQVEAELKIANVEMDAAAPKLIEKVQEAVDELGLGDKVTADNVWRLYGRNDVSETLDKKYGTLEMIPITTPYQQAQERVEELTKKQNGLANSIEEANKVIEAEGKALLGENVDVEAYLKAQDEKANAMNAQTDAYIDLVGAVEKAVDAENDLVDINERVGDAASAIGDEQNAGAMGINEQLSLTEEGKEALDETMSEAQRIVTEACETMTGSVTDMVTSFNQSGQAYINAFATANGLRRGFAVGYEGFASIVGSYLSLLDELQSKSHIDVNAPVSLPNTGDGIDTSGLSTSNTNADGLSYVPYDDYLSYLHRGEAVLTAAQADDWRAGRDGYGDGGSTEITVDMIASAVSQALRGVTVQMDGTMVGHLVADTVSRDIARAAMGPMRYIQIG